jgi:hypothetical protein
MPATVSGFGLCPTLGGGSGKDTLGRPGASLRRGAVGHHAVSQEFTVRLKPS